MSGIRVGEFLHELREKDLKNYFSKPENGGGPIKKIYYPLFGDSAVIIFENEHTADLVIAHKERTGDSRQSNFSISHLPLMQQQQMSCSVPRSFSFQPILNQLQAFTKLTATVDGTVLVLLQSVPAILDEIQHIGNLEYHYDNKSNQATLTGDWYQLEWAWAMLDACMHAQRSIHTQLSNDLGRRSMDKSAILPKGEKPGDVDSPLTSMSDIYTADDVNEDSRNRRDVDETDETGADGVTETAIKISHQSGKYKTSMMDHGAAKSEMSASNVAMAIAQMKDVNVSSDEHVSILGKQCDKASTATNSTDMKRILRKTQILHDQPDDFRSLEFQVCDLNVSIYAGKITMVETEVIVNAAMGSLFNTRGVAKAIARAASPEMQKQCNDHVAEYGALSTSELMHTVAGGSLSDKVRYIVHAVGPVWSAGTNEDMCKFLLVKTFLNCFNYGNNNLKVSSMTLPLISSGTFGCPLEISVRAFVDAILLFTLEHEQEAPRLKEVHLVNDSGDATAVKVVQVRQLIGQGLDNICSEAVEFYNKLKAIEEQRNQSHQHSMKPGTRTIRETGQGREVKQPTPVTSGRPLPAVPLADDSKSKKKK